MRSRRPHRVGVPVRRVDTERYAARTGSRIDLRYQVRRLVERAD
ncbi:hypothetical protein [Plantactinospora sp. WMMB782]